MSDSELVQLTKFDIPRAEGPTSIPVYAARPIFIVGGNGTGKSALVQHIVGQLTQINVVYVPGSRSNSFDQESLSMNPANRRQFEQNRQSWDRSLDTRWRNLSGNARNEKAIHDLQMAEIQYVVDAMKDIKAQGAASTAIQKVQSNDSPVDWVNHIMVQSNLPTRMVVSNGELQVERDSGTYSIAKMSDGERAALIMAADVISAPAGSVFVLDEPELHLHRGITLPLIATLLKQRKECGFIVSTHELALPAEWADADSIIVRECKWVGDQPQYWDFDILAASAPVPEELRIDILGSRKKVLFVEGKASSLDAPIYSLLFPQATVIPRDSSRDVQNAVAGLRANQEAHHTLAFGIVDNDGIPPGQLARLAENFVFALPVYSVEGLYYCREVLEAVAQKKAELGYTPSQLLQNGKDRALLPLANEEAVVNLASWLCEKHLRNKILSAIPDRDGMLAFGGNLVTIAIPALLPAEISDLKALVQAGDIDAIVARYPVRETSNVLPGLAKGLGFPNRAEYERAALVRIEADSELRNKLRSKLGSLASLLM